MTILKIIIKLADSPNQSTPSQTLPRIVPKRQKTRTGRALEVMELTGVEPVSKLGINTPLIHRFSFSSPRSGNPTLCPVGRTPGFDLKLVSNPINETKSIRWGYSSIVNGVESEALEPRLKGYLGSNWCGFTREGFDVVCIYLF